MKADLKEKWIEALRSGKYKQGTGWLHRDGEYCCLGVLAEVAGAKWRKQEGTLALVPVIDGKDVGEVTMLDMDRFLCNEIGLLASMNDTGATFLEIADYIEGNL